MMSKPATNPWLVIPRPNPAARVRLFCFPYAGGSAAIYRAWPDNLPESVETIIIQPPGRGNRIMETAFNKLTALVEAIGEVIVPELDQPFAFFGHSMGAMVSFELARLLRRNKEPQPSHLFISGRRAPQIPSTRKPTYDLSDDEFMEGLRELKGTPEEALEHPELMQLMLPLLRADFEVVQTYKYTPEPPLDCPISVFGGIEDFDEHEEYLEAWREQTTAAFSLQMFSGDHFFINTCQAQLLRALSEQLNRLAAPPIE